MRKTVSPSGGEGVLEVRGVFLSRENRPVLENVSLDLKKGELLCLLGANGAGKTSLFRCILALEKYRGLIISGGKDVAKLRPPELAQKIAYIPQASRPSFNYTVFEMTLMGTAARPREMNAPGPERKKTARDALEKAGIGRLADRGFCSLSGGEQQLCLVARAIAQRADVFVMDEPTANLDYGNQFRVLDLIRSLCRQGHSIIMSTHSPEHALRFADRVAALHHRRVIACGPPGGVIVPDLIETLYGVKPKDTGIFQAVATVPVISK